MKQHDIVQVKPDAPHWPGCLVIVDEVRSWGIQGFVPMPPTGEPAYVRLLTEHFEPVGAQAVFIPKED